MDLLIEKLAAVAREYNAIFCYRYNRGFDEMEFYFTRSDNALRFKCCVDCYPFKMCPFAYNLIGDVEKQVREKLEVMGWQKL